MAINWKDILKFTGGGTASVLVLLTLILNLAGMSYTHDGDKSCGEICYSEIQVNSTTWNINVEHGGEEQNLIYKKGNWFVRLFSRTLWLNLDKMSNIATTNPSIKIELLIPSDEKHATEYNKQYGYLKQLEDGDTLIKRSSKNSPVPNRIIIKGYKDEREEVKWSFDMNYVLAENINIDPYWYPKEFLNVNLVDKQEYHNWSDKQLQWFVNETCEWIESNSSWSSCYYQDYAVVNHSDLIREWQELTINTETQDLTDWHVWCWDDLVDKIWCKSYWDGDANYKTKTIKAGISYFWVNYDESVIFYTDDYYGKFYLEKLQEMIS